MSELPSNVALSAPKSVRRASAALAAAVLVAGLSACSATPDAVKPGMIYGETAAAETPEGTKGFPQLADTPDKRPDATSVKDQKAIADSLAADRNTARDNDAALKSGTEPQAAKPSAAEQKAAAYAAENEPAPNPVSVAAAAAVPAAAPAPSYVAAAPQAAPVSKSAHAPVAAAARAPEPVPVRVAAAPARAPEPVFAPEPIAEAAKPAQAPRDMIAMADTSAPSESAAPVLETRALIVNGVIPLPPRGGHKTYAEVKAQQIGGIDEVDEPAAAEEPAAKADVEAPVTAAPTKKVIVKPVVGNEP